MPLRAVPPQFGIRESGILASMKVIEAMRRCAGVTQSASRKPVRLNNQKCWEILIPPAIFR